MEPIEMLNKHCEFNNEYECYVLLAVSRKKDTPEMTNSKEIVFREIIKNREDIVRKYNKIKSCVINYKDENGKSYPFYIYITNNNRNSKKAMFSLMNRMMGWIQEESNGVERSKMFKKIDDYFISETMKYINHGTNKYFLFDYDEKNKFNDFEEVLIKKGIVTFIIQETRNGYHIKTKPFDPRLLQHLDKSKFPFEIKKDALLFVEYVKNEN